MGVDMHHTPPASRGSRASGLGSRYAGDATPPRSSGSGSSENLDQSTLTFPASDEDNISVVIRVRPLSDRENKSGDDEVVQFPGNGQLLLEGNLVAQKPRLFSFHAVFGPGATQNDVLHFSGVERLLQLAVEGFSSTVFCYGQTGSGKTHTLTGPPGLFDKKPDPLDPNHGLVFSSFVFLFQLLSQKPDVHFVLKASFLEIYNEKVIDLLNPGSARKPLSVRWSKKSRGFFVENLFTVDCEQLDDLLAVLEEGMRNRSVGAHNMNDHSSRSHTILTVHITSEMSADDGVFITKQGKINFVDLAGSEMTKKTHSEGKTLEEANNINKSLMVLGYCIASLSDSKKKGGHIPYRDSKLTKLLADSLAGNGVTLMIACVSPAKSNYTETLNTLRYAARAKKIRTKPVVVMDPREALILSLKREVNALQDENDHLRNALQLSASTSEPSRSRMNSADKGSGRRRSMSGPVRGEWSSKVPWPDGVSPDISKLADLKPEDLAKMAEHFLRENEALRKENSDLFSTREALLRDQELVCRENERLLRKLEDVNSVCCRSPIIPARPTYSADKAQLPQTEADVWTNPLAQSDSSVYGPRFKQDIISERNSSKPPHRLPDSIQKELDKRRIGMTAKS
ncbi:kinesin-like protein KIF12 isoform X2 [Neocloeon triangulifer]|uniref:kinesin-like protein KIF12 isoform X2 n=1 Tax=Neocloeon triangulifer TaxID=2078957 RepID=UPI00286ECB07|nr:kinesin-like protein KIF12 isoform X2 [Neocloeon triangulifer]